MPISGALPGGAGGIDGSEASAIGKDGGDATSSQGGSAGGGGVNLETGFGAHGGAIGTPLNGTKATTFGATGTMGQAVTSATTITTTITGGTGGLGPAAQGTPGVSGSVSAGGQGGGGVGISAGADIIVANGGVVRGGTGGGGATTALAAGGGGGGGVGIFSNSNVTVDAGGTVIGGTGGRSANSGGGGGAAAIVLSAKGAVVNSGTLTGGTGGQASISNSGGGGGAGVLLLQGGSLTNLADGVISGGAGGTTMTAARVGPGGEGIKGRDMTIVNAGTITGALAGGTAPARPRANAITFTGGVNSLELWSSSVITGNVQAFSSADRLILGGVSDGTFDTAEIGDAAKYRGFGIFEKTGPSTWTLTGTTTAVTPWTLSGGVLAIGADGSLGDAAGALTFNGGTLRTTADIAMTRGITLSETGGMIETATGTTLTQNGTISGPGGFSKIGNGALELAAANSYEGETVISAGTLVLSGAGGIANSRRVVADSAFDISAIDTATMIKSLAGSGLVEFGDKELMLTAANDTFSGQFSGAGSFAMAGGRQVLNGDSSGFGGASRVEGGMLIVNGRLGGAMDVLGGILAGAGTVGATTNGAGGVIAPGEDGIGTLTIAGNYTSNGGVIAIETGLGGNGSPTDLLIITGDTILGSSATSVVVTNLGGQGGETTGDGIRIIQVDGVSAADTFALSGPAIGGAWRYDIFHNGVTDPADGDWYLRSTSLAPTTPVYQNYPQVLLGMVTLPTLQQRVGDRYWAATEPSALWTRIEGSFGRTKASSSPSDAHYDSETALVQVGADVRVAEYADGMLLGGLTAQFGDASADIHSDLGDGENSTQSYGLGATLTWSGKNGFYTDAQAQIALLRSDLSADGLGEIGDSINGHGYALSLEAGLQHALGGGWSLTPQAQLVFASVDFDSFADRYGARISLDEGDSLKGRVGLTMDYAADAGSHVYGIANLTYEFLDGTTVAVSGVELAFEPQRFGGEVGFGGSYGWADGKYALNGEALAATSFEGSHSLKGTVGLTIGF